MEVVFGNRCPKEALEAVAKDQDAGLSESGDPLESLDSSEEPGEGDEGEEAEAPEVPEGPKASAEPVPAASPAPVTTARQVLASWVPKCSARPVYEEAGLLFHYERGYRIYLTEPESQEVRDRIRREGSSTDGEMPLV